MDPRHHLNYPPPGCRSVFCSQLPMVLRLWLQPAPDGRALLPSPQRASLLKVLMVLPVQKSHLRESGIGKLVVAMAAHPEETRDNRELIKQARGTDGWRMHGLTYSITTEREREREWVGGVASEFRTHRMRLVFLHVHIYFEVCLGGIHQSPQNIMSSPEIISFVVSEPKSFFLFLAEIGSTSHISHISASPFLA